jgi:hypothetical protein
VFVISLIFSLFFKKHIEIISGIHPNFQAILRNPSLDKEGDFKNKTLFPWNDIEAYSLLLCGKRKKGKTLSHVLGRNLA